jgi:hypothetical protein
MPPNKNLKEFDKLEERGIEQKEIKISRSLKFNGGV